jgi:hypothetical protein
MSGKYSAEMAAAYRRHHCLTATPLILKISLNDLPHCRCMLRVVAIVLSLWAVDHYMLNGQMTDAALDMSQSILHYSRIL